MRNSNLIISFLETFGARRRENEKISSPEIFRAPKKIWRVGVSKGFTLVELLVTVSIAAVIMGIVIYSYGQFNIKLSVSAAAQEMAIEVRKAQTYGLSVKETSPGTGQFNVAYGLAFGSGNVFGQGYVLFVDRNGNGQYDPSGGNCGAATNECIERIIPRNNVAQFPPCDGSGYCVPSTGFAQIMFLRPNPDASIQFFDHWTGTGGGRVLLETPSIIKIKLYLRGIFQTVIVQSTGQISIQ